MTINTAPQTIHDDLLEEIAAYYSGAKAPDEFSLRALKKKAEALSKADFAEGAEIQGLIAFLQGNEASGIELVERAIKHSSSKAPIVIRYLQMCDHIGRFDRLAEIVEKYRAALAGNPTETREAMTTLASAGFLNRADQLGSDLERMNVGYQGVFFAPGERLVSRCDHSEFTDEDTSAAVIFARSFLFRRRVSVKSISLAVVAGEGERESSILYDFGVLASPEEAVSLEWDLFGELEREKFLAETSGKFLFSVTSFETPALAAV